MNTAKGELILILSGLASGMKPNDASSIQGVVSASHGGGHILECLVAEIPQTEIVFRIREMLNASYVNKAGTEYPDYRAREAGIKLYLSYTVGLPLQRQIVANVAHERPSEEANWERILTSPAARRFLMEKLIKAGEEMEHLPDV